MVTDFHGERIEKLLSKPEANAAPSIKSDDRVALAWWVAAQIVRTLCSVVGLRLPLAKQATSWRSPTRPDRL